jgi:hypothetical protein
MIVRRAASRVYVEPTRSKADMTRFAALAGSRKIRIWTTPSAAQGWKKAISRPMTNLLTPGEGRSPNRRRITRKRRLRPMGRDGSNARERPARLYQCGLN